MSISINLLLLSKILKFRLHHQPQYDKEKYKEMLLDAAETVLGFLALIGLSTVTSRSEVEGNGEELQEQKARDIETEML